MGNVVARAHVHRLGRDLKLLSGNAWIGITGG